MKKTDENLENTNIFEDDENHYEESNKKFQKGYFEEQDEIKKRFNLLKCIII